MRLFVVGLCVSVLAAGCSSGSGSSRSDDSPTQPPPPPAPEMAGLSPQSFALTLAEGSTSEASFSFNNSGNASLTYDVATAASWITLMSNVQGSLASGNAATVQFSVACSSGDLNGSIELTTNDSDEGAISIPVAASCVPTDFEIQRMTLNQGARSFDSGVVPTMNMQTLAGRDLLVRAFVTGSGPVPDAEVVVTDSNSVETFAMTSPLAIGAAPAADGDLAGSYHVVIPGAAIEEGAELRVVVGPGSALPARYPDSSNLDLTAVDPGTFEITFVPVTFEDQTPSIDPDIYLRDALKVLPIGAIDVEIRTPYVFTDAYDLGELLTAIGELRDQDGSTRLYHGVIIPPGGFQSGTAGIGYVGFPASVSVDLSGEGFVVAHELGHNLNLSHAPGCSTPDPDAAFPHTDGEIGVWGFDFAVNALIDPAGGFNDFMAYCQDLWVSDYHFSNALSHRDQSLIGFGPPLSGMTISGMLGPHGEWQNVRFTPSRHMLERAESVEWPYRLRGWDSNGSEVVNAAFRTHGVPDLDERQSFLVNIPMPTAAIDHFQIEANGAVVHTARLDARYGPGSAPRSIDYVDGIVSWQRSGADTLIVRNAAGEVVAMDRSGRFSLRSVRGPVSLERALGSETYFIER